MSIITKIEAQKKYKDRVNVYIDGEYRLSMNYDLLLKSGIKVNEEVNEQTLNELVLENEKSLALSRASTLLGKNLKTVKQMKDYLFGKGYGPNVVEYCIKKLSEYNYLNDENYVNIYLKSASKKYGKYKIENELKLKGVPKNIIDSALDDFKVDSEVIFDLSKKFLKNKEINNDNITKLVRHLLSKGYNYDDIKEVTNSLRRNSDAWSWDWFVRYC